MSKMNYNTINKANIKPVNIAENNEKHTEHFLNVSEFDITSCFIGREDVTKKVIKLIERFCRSSFEYREYINYLKEELDITRCAILSNIDIKEIPIGIEFHHMPISMFEVCYTIASAMTDNDERVSVLQICEQVMKEHYEGHIGLVPLTNTMPEAVHNGVIKVPLSLVYGNWYYFYRKYEKYLSNDSKTKLEYLLSISDKEAEENNSEKLEKNISNYNIKYRSNNNFISEE